MNSTSPKRSFLSTSGAVSMLHRTWLCVLMVLVISSGTCAHYDFTDLAHRNSGNSVAGHDLMAITVTCPTDINVYATAGDCSAFVTISTPTVLGFSGAYILTNDFNGTADASDTYPVGITTVIFSAEDGTGTGTCSMSVTVKDNTDPTITCPADIIVGNDAGVCGAVVNYAAPIGADNCSGATTIMTSAGTASGSTFPLGMTTVTYETTDATGLIANCSFTITVNDLEAPLTLCQDVTVQLDASGNASVTAAQVNNGSSDNCGIDLMTLDVIDFTCANVGANTVTLSVLDASGNISTCTATVTVEDNIVPLLMCPGNISVNNEPGMCDAVVNYATPVGTDNCDLPVTTMVSFDTGSGATFPVGVTPVFYRVEDVNGNFTECFFDVTVLDSEAPTITCPADITVDNDPGACGAEVFYTEPEGLDNCVFALTALATPLGSGDFFPIGTTTVTYDVLDADGNLASCSFTITVIDAEDPVITCPSDIIVGNDGGVCGAIVNYAVPIGTDNCFGTTTTMTTVGTASGSTFPMGVTTVTYEVIGLNSNTASCSFTVTVKDREDPLAICQTASSTMDANGWAVFTPAMLNNGSIDNCAITSMIVEPDSFNSVGNHDVLFIVFDEAGNSDTCLVQCEVIDDTPPNAVCQDITLYLNSIGTASILPAELDGGSTDNGVINGISASQLTFNCGDLGANSDTLVITDSGGNTSFCIATVMVVDTIAPNVTCQNITVQLDAIGSVELSPMQVDNGSLDNCAGSTLALDITSFDCSNIGANTVLLTITDQSGNASTCSATVTVEDTISPTAICQDITLQLNATGTASITAEQINNGSNDACGIATLVADVTNFNCSNVGANTVILTVTDNNGNTSTCLSTVTVKDTIAPVAICQNVTTFLDPSGNTSITASDLDNGSFNICGGITLTAGQTAFDCTGTGENIVTLTVTDPYGNSAACDAVVTVLDTIAPVVSCRNITVQLDTSGNASIDAADIDNGSYDACGISSMSADMTSFDCNSKGPHTVTLTVTDNSGNESTCQSIVTVEDTVTPIVVCRNLTTYLNASGNASIDAIDLDNGSTDACGGLTFSASHTAFNCATTGANDVILTVTDPNGNSTACAAIVTVLDTIRPSAICQNVTYTLPNMQNAQITLTPAQLNNGSADNCVGSTFAISQSVFQHVGTFQDTLFVTDASGNVSFCVSSVTINDFTTPVAACNATDIYLNALGTASITTHDLDGGSTDNGTIVSMTASQYIFNCSHQGPNNVTLIVTDEANNSSFCTTVVTVIDTIAPTAICQNITVNKDPTTGIASITGTHIGGQSTDNCGTGGLTLSIDTNTFSSGGQHTVILTVTDASGNTSTCEAIVTVVDNTAPVANCKPVTVYVNEFGIASIIGNDIDNGSFDNEGIVAYLATPNMFNCGNLGTNTTVLTVTDQSGNTDDCVTVVTVLDTIPPTVICQNLTVVLNSQGLATISSTDINNGTFDNCSSATLTYSISANTFTDIGEYTVVLTATDPSGNSTSCEAIVTVGDDLPPVVLCQPTTTYLELNGNATITADDIDGGSYDNGVLESLVAGQTVFSCSDLGSNQIILTGTDDRGNMATCSALVTVLDTIAPVAICQDITVVMDFFGNATLDGIEMDGGSTDNCGSGSLQYTSSITSFTEEGTFEVVLTAADAGGNISFCTAQVTVEQPVKPLVIPAGFSPNADGIADTWEIQGLREFPNNNLMIFNRWGAELFSAAPYENEWYGQVNVGSLPGEISAGTYFYILELGDGETRTGYIQLNK